MTRTSNRSSAVVHPRDHRHRHARLVPAALGIGLAVATLVPPGAAHAHGYAGQRFFPATLATDDPFVADELSLPTFTRMRTNDDGSPRATESDLSIDFTKRITADFGLGFGVDYLQQEQRGEKTQHGFDNLSTNAKYQFFKSEEHETILSFGADWDVGGTGAKRVGADSFSTVTPTFFFGKGFGDLPDSVKYLKPFAVTGTVGVGIPSRSSNRSFDDDGNLVVDQNPTTLQVGLAFEYSLPYLQAFVKDVGLPQPFSNLIPVVEVAMQKPLNRGRGPLTGTVNPGFLLAGKYTQLGIEAVIPMNHQSPGKTGVLVQLHFFIDDLFPKTFGKPLFGS